MNPPAPLGAAIGRPRVDEGIDPYAAVAGLFVGADAHIRPSAYGRFADGSMRASTPTRQLQA